MTRSQPASSKSFDRRLNLNNFFCSNNPPPHPHTRQPNEYTCRIFEGVGRVAEVELEHDRPRLRLRKRNVDSLLETTAHGWVQLPRDVRSPWMHGNV